MLYQKKHREKPVMNIKRQLHFIFFIAIFIPVTVIGSYLVYNTRSMLMDHYKNQCLSDNVRLKSMLLDMTLSIYDKSDTIASDQTLINILSKQYSSKKQSETAIVNYNKIETTIAHDPLIQSIQLYSMNPTIKKTDYVYGMTSDFKKTDCYQHFLKSSTPFWSVHDQNDRYGNTYIELRFHQKIFLPKIQSYAILVTTLSNNQLKNRIENSSLQTVLWVGNKQFFYCSGDQNNSVPSLFLKNYDQEKGSSYTGPIKYDHKNAIASISNLATAYSDDLFHIASIDTEGYQYIRTITATHILIILLVLVTAIIFASIYSGYFSNRVIALREAMHDASCGNYHITDDFKGQDEISEAFQDLNIMIKNIVEKETAAYETKIKTQQLINQQQQMEFKMLTSQINPHFLYNTLETIRMRALKAGNREVANAVKLLGKSMRYVLENTTLSFTSLDREMNYIETYLSIQTLRFHDKVNYSLRTTKGLDLSQYKIMPLLIQPIVENALLHGLEEVEENGRIIIHIQKVGQHLIIDIYDNGCGMTSEELKQMKQNMYHHKKDSSKSIGLANIYQRIQLYYGKEYGLKVDSEKGIGTIFTMTLPAQKYEKGENQ